LIWTGKPPRIGSGTLLQVFKQRSSSKIIAESNSEFGPMLGFKRFETAAVTIRGIELAEKLRKINSTSTP
jgi:hypothetical protein